MNSYDLSIVLPTCNRAGLLEQAIDSIAVTTRCNFELIVVDGASTDHTRDVIAKAKQRLGDSLVAIHEDKREGFVRGTNKGFRVATGRNLCWLNDDAKPMDGTLDSAVVQIDSASKSVAFLAMFHAWHSPMNVAYQVSRGGEAFSLCHVRGTLYGNFQVGRTEIYRELGFFDERYFVCAADPDLSLKAWHAGYRVEPAWGCIIDHAEVEDDRRAVDSQRGKADNASLFAKWDLPERNAWKNDFDPMNPCTLRGLKAESVKEFTGLAA